MHSKSKHIHFLSVIIHGLFISTKIATKSLKSTTFTFFNFIFFIFNWLFAI